MLSDRKAFLTLHLRWFLAAITATALVVGWYTLETIRAGRIPGGSSLVGLTLGVLAAAIIIFECLLGLRRTRQFRTARWLGSAQLWMKAHIWLGLFAVPLVLLHSGFHWGSLLSTLVAGSFALVTASGIFGWYMQNLIPRWLLEAVPEETIHSQLEEVADQLCTDARRIAGLLAAASEMPELPAAGRRLASNVVRAGAPRRVGTMLERSPRPQHEPLEVVISAIVQQAVLEEIEPFLRTGQSRQRGLHSAQRSGWYFEELRRRIDDRRLQATVNHLERLCERRRQMNLQRTLHFWLHGWLSIHLPLAMALLVLLLAHIWFALRYS